MTTILAVDAATGPCSAAIWHEGRIAAYREHLPPVMQSARLLPMIEETLAESGMTYRDLSAVACTVGPGGFTGIRSGLAAARGIAFAAGIPGLGFTTLSVLAHAAAPHAASASRIISVLNAGKGEAYCQSFDASGKPLAEPMLATPDTIDTSNAVTIGHAASLPLQRVIDAFPRADMLASLAAEQAGGALPLTPFYIRPPDAKLPTAR